MHHVRRLRRYGGIAQLVEHTAHIRSVIGPIPIAARKSRLPSHPGGGTLCTRTSSPFTNIQKSLSQAPVIVGTTQVKTVFR